MGLKLSRDVVRVGWMACVFPAALRVSGLPASSLLVRSDRWEANTMITCSGSACLLCYIRIVLSKYAKVMTLTLGARLGCSHCCRPWPKVNGFCLI